MLKEEFPPELDWFSIINVLVDLGYLGIQTDYTGEQKPPELCFALLTKSQSVRLAFLFLAQG